MKWWLLAATVHALLKLLFETPAVSAMLYRLAWRLGPWASFPFPYDLEGHGWPLIMSETLTWISLFVWAVLVLTLCVAVLHGLVFAVVVLVHAWRGWPRYWQDVRRRIHWPSLWAASAKRSWWIWPAAQLIWLPLDGMALVFVYASYPIVDTGYPFAFCYALGVCLLLAIVADRVVRTYVADAVGPDDLRCGRCGYLLRGLVIQRCPECGYGGNRDGKVEYGLLRRRRGRWRGVRAPLLAAVITALMATPVWAPSSLTRIPPPWSQWVPEFILSSSYVPRFVPHLFPIRFDAICVLRHDDAIAIVRFQPANPYRADYQVAYWLESADMECGKPPHSVSRGQVKLGGGRDLLIGPWTLSYQALGGGMFWLFPPDETYSVEAFEVHDLPDGLCTVVEQWLSDEQPGGR